MPIVWLEIAKIPPKISAQFLCPSPKVLNFLKKALSGCPLSVGSTVKNVEGGVYSRGETEISVRVGEAWYSGGRKCQGGEGLRWEKVCKPGLKVHVTEVTYIICILM